VLAQKRGKREERDDCKSAVSIVWSGRATDVARGSLKSRETCKNGQAKNSREEGQRESRSDQRGKNSNANLCKKSVGNP